MLMYKAFPLIEFFLKHDTSAAAVELLSGQKLEKVDKCEDMKLDEDEAE